MNDFETKKILQLYRPDSDDANDRQIAEALQVARQNPELGIWLKQHNRFQAAMHEKFQEIAVPADLKEKILEQRKIVHPPPFWRNPVLLRIAASVILLAGLGFGIYAWNKPRVPDRFADYESRMVRSALREYHMDIVTDDLPRVRQWMSSHGAPADFSLPKGLAQLQLTGGGVLRWRNNPVSMICFNRGDNEMIFLFVMNRSAVKDPPPTNAELDRVSKLMTASWTEGDKTYLLAGPKDADFLKKYL